MKYQTINLKVQYRDKGVSNNDFQPTLTTYIHDDNPEIPKQKSRPMVIVCPGGAYAYCSLREAEPVALKLASYGYNTCVLNYSCAPMEFPAAFLDLCEAVYYVRTNAKLLNTNPNQIIIAGFSAAGHLAASLGVFWNTGLAQKYLPYKAQDIKPNALCLGYPVISSGPFGHKDTINNVLGPKNKDEEMLKYVSLETKVNKDVPPVFLWHTFEDKSVPVENSLMFATELRKKDIPFEYHIFTRGGHGLSLSTEETAINQSQIIPEVAVWPDLFNTWVKNNLK